MNHPRPRFRRSHWRSLDGAWACALNPAEDPGGVAFDRAIQVPYAPESPRSGLHTSGAHPTGASPMAKHPVVWYRQTFTLGAADQPGPGEQLLLHFGAVDWSCQVWVNGTPAGGHEGGYTPFALDLTPHLQGERLTITLRADDDPDDLHQPRGKQDWEAVPHAIWYPRTSGIWQTVWLERVPVARLLGVQLTPDLTRFEIGLEAQVTPQARGLRLRTRLGLGGPGPGGRMLADDTSVLTGEHVQRGIGLPDPGIDDARADLLWSPEHPQLLDLSLELLDDAGVVIDRVESYTAMRSVGTDGDRFTLNGRPYMPRMVLDQGYWPQGGLTATPEELRADVELTKRLGFDGAHKHQKIEAPAYLYWADVLGLLVWEELPSAYAFSARSTARLTRTWLEAIERDRSHPCIVAWVPFNESWGVPDLAGDARHRALVQGLYHLTRSLDASRPVVGNDGWEQQGTDLLTIHDYSDDPDDLLERYGDPAALGVSLQRVRSAGRRLVLAGYDQETARPALLTEFGGIAYGASGERGWGYSAHRTAEAYGAHYVQLLEAVHASTALHGFCYTQLTDTDQEINGLADMQRVPKYPPELIAAATRGRLFKSGDQVAADSAEGEPTQSLPPQTDQLSADLSNLPPGRVPTRNNPLGYSVRWLKKLWRERALAEPTEAERRPAGRP